MDIVQLSQYLATPEGQRMMAALSAQAQNSSFTPGCAVPGAPIGGRGQPNGRRLNGFPDCVGDPIVFAFNSGSVAAAASFTFNLKPRTPVFLLGMTVDDPTIAGVFNITSFKWAGDDAYPDGGSNSTGITRLPQLESFTPEMLEARANPWPRTPMLCDDARNLELIVNNSSGVAAILTGFIFGVLADTSHGDWAAVNARCQPAGK